MEKQFEKSIYFVFKLSEIRVQMCFQIVHGIFKSYGVTYFKDGVTLKISGKNVPFAQHLTAEDLVMFS